MSARISALRGGGSGGGGGGDGDVACVGGLNAPRIGGGVTAGVFDAACRGVSAGVSVGLRIGVRIGVRIGGAGWRYHFCAGVALSRS